MRIALRGTIRTSLGQESVELALPHDGVPLSVVLANLASTYPRIERYFARPELKRTLRVVHNGAVLDDGLDPRLVDQDELLLLVSVAGG